MTGEMRTFCITWSGKVNWSSIGAFSSAGACSNGTLIICTLNYVQLKLKCHIVEDPAKCLIAFIAAVVTTKAVANHQAVCLSLIHCTPPELG